MKKFKCTVTRTDEYIIEFDETKCNEEWMKAFREVFYNFDDLEEHAEHIAQHRARFQEKFIEGYGMPLINGERPYILYENGESSVNNAINIIIEDEGDCDVEVEGLE